MPRPTLDRTRHALVAGETTVHATVENFLARIEAERHRNAFLTVFRDRARSRARDVDARIATGTAGPLAGMVVAVKDALCVRDERTTCGSRILHDFVSPYDATVVRRLEAADAVIIGKTNMDEFAMGSSSENSAYGPVLNPADESRVPGGSSGGSAVAVAGEMAHAALGSDTGGSIRQPAAFCGVVGLKPTYGRVSRHGLIALASSFDQVGPFAHSVIDASRVLEVIAGYDELDSTSSRLPVPEFSRELTGDLHGVRVGVPAEALTGGVQVEIFDAIEGAKRALGGAGAEILDVELPHSRYSIAAYYVLMTAEASSNLARYDGARYGTRAADAKDLGGMYSRSRSEGFGAEARRRIILGTYVLSAGYYDAYYRKAQKVRRLIQEDFTSAFRTVDCLLLPTTPTTAFRIGEKIDDPLQMYLSDVFTVSANLAGVPALSVPFGHDRQGLPIGVQLIGRHFDECTLLRSAHVLEIV